MAPKLLPDPINANVLINYLDNHSDFHFELKILKLLTHLGIHWDHGGNYVDPVTGKSREFDIRARIAHEFYRVQIAIECKNLQPNFPLMVIAVPRAIRESYIGHLRIRSASHPGALPPSSLFASRAKSYRLEEGNPIYPEWEPVGKSTIQVGLSSNKDREIVAGDSEVYEKWGQCLNSLGDMIIEMGHMTRAELPSRAMATAIPILVVPNGSLWQTVYNLNGDRIIDPIQVDRTSVFIGKAYRLTEFYPVDFEVSHLEIMTENGLVSFVERCLTSAEKINEALFNKKDELPIG